MKKALLTLLLTLALLFTLCACGGNTDCTEHKDLDNDGKCDICQAEMKDDDENEDVSYTVTWIDEKGNTIKTESVKEGSVPSYSYEVSDTAEWDYTFDGWKDTADGEILSSIPAASKDASYYASVSSVKQKYTVSFDSMGGSTVASQTVEYGSKASLPEPPSYEGHKFMGWSTSCDSVINADFESAVTGNVEYYAVWNKVLDVKSLLSSLLGGYKLNPLSFIPETMLENYSANLVESDGIVNDYADFVNVSDITYGHGEQWHMILKNINESQTFFNVLSVLDGLSTASITAFNNYFDQNPSDSGTHEFESGIYNVTIKFDSESLFYVLDYTANLPLLGEQTVQIALTMDIETGEKTVRIQLGDANALLYKVSENSYEFAIKYLGVRRAMFTVERNGDGSVSGKIYEHLTVSQVDIASAAEFYITNDYVSVVGNKANGLIGFTGYICELYNVKTGKLIGYEVQEKLSALVYNTLWFDLKDIDGINSIKYQAKTDDSDAKIFVNGSSNEWTAKKVLLSRRFDIEFRTQYVYSYDSATEKYVEHEIQVPMIFVQEDNYDTFVKDVKSTNNVEISVGVSNKDLIKILTDYDTLIPIFIENKDKVTSDLIIEYIGNKLS